VTRDFALPRSRAYLIDPGVLYFFKYAASTASFSRSDLVRLVRIGICWPSISKVPHGSMRNVRYQPCGLMSTSAQILVLQRPQARADEPVRLRAGPDTHDLALIKGCHDRLGKPAFRIVASHARKDIEILVAQATTAASRQTPRLITIASAMSSQLPRPLDDNLLPLEPAYQADEEQANATLAQLSLLAILCSVMILLGLFAPPRRWPVWGKIAGLTGVFLCGWIGIASILKLSKRRFKNWRLSGGLRPCDAWLVQGRAPNQPLKLRIRQQTFRRVSVDRLDISLIHVETTAQVYLDPASPNSHPAVLRDRELWSHTMTRAIDKSSIPADGVIDISIEVALPKEDELQRRQPQECPGPGQRKTEEARHCQWRLRIETHLADGRAAQALFSLPSEFGRPARPETQTNE